jgi:hypothetical protein
MNRLVNRPVTTTCRKPMRTVLAPIAVGDTEKRFGPLYWIREPNETAYQFRARGCKRHQKVEAGIVA